MTRAKSYLRPSFDGCEACSDVALDAIVQSALYVLARALPDALDHGGDVRLSYRLRVRLEDEAGTEIVVDEVEAEQHVSLEAAPDEWDVGPVAGEPEAGGEPSTTEPEREAHASLGDFQAMIDRVVLEPASPTEVSGLIKGRLFGFERFVGPFEVLISPC